MDSWRQHAEHLAGQITRPGSPWAAPVAEVPRHLFVPRWWRDPGQGWTLRDGESDPQQWANAAYTDRTLVTMVGSLHADHATPEDHPSGLPTSSSTMPGLMVKMFRHAEIQSGQDVTEIGTGSGYGCALLCSRLGERRVMSIDVNSYLTKAATERLDGCGMRPQIVTADATDTLPGTCDRIVSTVAVHPKIPPAWLSALRPGGRLVTTLTGMQVIITADRTLDGGATGRVEWDRAGFMGSHHGAGLADLEPNDAEGEHVGTGRYPVVDVAEAWELRSMFELDHPGTRHHFRQEADGRRTAWLNHPDGSWARAVAEDDAEPIVHQSGPRRLWDDLDGFRHRWLTDGSLPLYGARATVDPDGTVHLTRGRWRQTITTD